MSALADYGLIWRHAVAPSAKRKVIWVICLLFAAGGAWLVYQDGGVKIGPGPVALIVLPVLLVAMLYWLELAAGAVKQLTPANAQLVPRLRPRAIQLVAACFIVFALLAIVLLGGIFGNKALWAAAVSAWLVGSAMTRIGLQHGMALQFFPLLMMMLPRPVLQSVRDAAATQLGAALCGIVVVAVAWYGVRVLFPTGERHFRQRAAVEKGVRALGQGGGVDQHAMAMRTPRGWYAADLARAGRNRKARGELMLHALGPGAHWSVSASVLAALALVLVAGRVLIELTSSDNQQAVSVVGGFVVFPLLLLFASAPQRIVARAVVTAGEQALLRLTPAAPQARAFNRKLGDALMRRALIEWALVAAGLVGVTVMVECALDHHAAAAGGVLPCPAADHCRTARLRALAATGQLLHLLRRARPGTVSRRGVFRIVARVSGAGAGHRNSHRRERHGGHRGVTQRDNGAGAAGVPGRPDGGVTSAWRICHADGDGDGVRRRFFMGRAPGGRFGCRKHDLHAVERLRCEGGPGGVQQKRLGCRLAGQREVVDQAAGPDAAGVRRTAAVGGALVAQAEHWAERHGLPRLQRQRGIVHGSLRDGGARRDQACGCGCQVVCRVRKHGVNASTTGLISVSKCHRRTRAQSERHPQVPFVDQCRTA